MTRVHVRAVSTGGGIDRQTGSKASGTHLGSGTGSRRDRLWLEGGGVEANVRSCATWAPSSRSAQVSAAAVTGVVAAADIVTSCVRRDIDRPASPTATCRSTVAVVICQSTCAVGRLSMLIGERVGPVVLPILANAIDCPQARSDPRHHNFATTRAPR
jgi:hypothetical protein